MTFIAKISLMCSLLTIISSATAATYCNGMGVLAELTVKMRDKGLSEKSALKELRKISPPGKINQDIADLVNVAYSNFVRGQSPTEFRSFFESFCKKNGYERELH